MEAGLTVRIAPVVSKPYRPRRLDRHELLVSLARQGRKLSEIAEVYGGTKQGVRSNIRRLRERGVL